MSGREWRRMQAWALTLVGVPNTSLLFAHHLIRSTVSAAYVVIIHHDKLLVVAGIGTAPVRESTSCLEVDFSCFVRRWFDWFDYGKDSLVVSPRLQPRHSAPPYCSLVVSNVVDCITAYRLYTPKVCSCSTMMTRLFSQSQAPNQYGGLKLFCPPRFTRLSRSQRSTTGRTTPAVRR